MAASSSNSTRVLNDVLKKFTALTEKPELFLEKQTKVATSFRSLTKKLYDFTKTTEEHQTIDTLPELIVKNFDDEQIWQQIELQNKFYYQLFIEKIAHILSEQSNLCLFVEKHDENLVVKPETECILETSEVESELSFVDDDGEDKSSDIDSFASSSEDLPLKSDSANESRLNKPKEKKPSIVDDKFFKLQELEEFLNQEDAKESKQTKDEDVSEDTVDYFRSLSSESEKDTDDEVENSEKKSSRHFKYDDFFDPLSENENSYDSDGMGKLELDESKQMETYEDGLSDKNKEELSNDENSLSGNEVKSSFEMRQESIKRRIADLEENNLAEKPWQLRGEASASSRPENSLLQEHFQFEHTQRQAPVITKETTAKLEDIIKQRIKDQVWDDVERKIKPKEEPFEYRKRIVLDQEKSKISLAEVYEKEYQKQQQKEKQVEEIPAHEEIKKMMNSLFRELDALSNFHFTPKMAVPELKIVSNLKSVTVEEVAPVAASTVSLLTPGEVMAKPVREVKGVTERSKTDKLRERRLKKIKQRTRRKEKEAREKIANKLDKTKNKYNKEKMLKNLVSNIEKDETKEKRKSELTSSKVVFSRLNELKTRPNAFVQRKEKKKNLKL